MCPFLFEFGALICLNFNFCNATTVSLVCLHPVSMETVSLVGENPGFGTLSGFVFRQK